MIKAYIGDKNGNPLPITSKKGFDYPVIENGEHFTICWTGSENDFMRVRSVRIQGKDVFPPHKYIGRFDEDYDLRIVNGAKQRVIFMNTPHPDYGTGLFTAAVKSHQEWDQLGAEKNDLSGLIELEWNLERNVTKEKKAQQNFQIGAKGTPSEAMRGGSLDAVEVTTYGNHSDSYGDTEDEFKEIPGTITKVFFRLIGPVKQQEVLKKFPSSQVPPLY